DEDDQVAFEAGRLHRRLDLLAARFREALQQAVACLDQQRIGRLPAADLDELLDNHLHPCHGFDRQHADLFADLRRRPFDNKHRHAVDILERSLTVLALRVTERLTCPGRSRRQQEKHEQKKQTQPPHDTLLTGKPAFKEQDFTSACSDTGIFGRLPWLPERGLKVYVVASGYVYAGWAAACAPSAKTAPARAPGVAPRGLGTSPPP